MNFSYRCALATLLYAALVILHLRAIARGDEHTRRWSKLLLCPLLAAGYLFCLSGAAVRLAPDTLLLAALLFSFLGDAALLGEGRFWTGSGMLAFMLAQFTYLAYIWRQLAPWIAARPERSPTFFALSLVAAAYLSVGLTMLWRIRKAAGRLLPLAALYGLALSAMSYSFLLWVYFDPQPGRWLAFAGSLCFLLSDAILSVQLFVAPSRRRNLVLMALYSLAQLAIVLGSGVFAVS